MNKYNVIFVDVAEFLSESPDVKGMVEGLKAALIKELRQAHADCPEIAEASTIMEMLREIYNLTDVNFVFVFDEWDCALRLAKNDTAGHKAYFEFLRSLLKDKSYVALAYMTGILPIKKYGTQSALNMFNEYSMADPKALARHAGFTEQEVRKACLEHGLSFELMKKWYDGYEFEGVHIYSPLSVASAIEEKTFASYWTATETYESLKAYISMNFDNLKETIVRLLGDLDSSAPVDTTLFQNDVSTFSSADDVLTLLVHLGYLGFRREKSEVFIPNKEVEEEFRKTLKDLSWNGLVEIGVLSKKLLEDTWSMNASAVAAAMQKAHQRINDLKTYNSEQALSNTVKWSYIYASHYYTVLTELQSGDGYIDLLYLPKPEHKQKPALLIELKWNRSAKGALNQIAAKNYPEKVKELAGDNILLIGINYDKKSKTHQCEIKKLQIPYA
jgi:hypothetical protein